MINNSFSNVHGSKLFEIIEYANKIPIDRKSIPQEQLDLANKIRSNRFSWRGQFSPELIEILLQKYAYPDAEILDPFVGCGTTLFESAQKNLSSYGVEINPAALEMSKTILFVNLGERERSEYIARAKYVIDRHLLQKNINRNLLEAMLFSAIKNKYLYNIVINSIMNSYLYSKYHLPTQSALLAGFKRHIDTINGLPFNSKDYKVFLADTRKLPIRNQVVDLIVTSPPYINVLNYHQNYREAMEIAGWNLLKVAKSEIGSNRKNRGNRFFTVIQYCIDMQQSLAEMLRVIKPNGRIIIVIGRESKVRGVSFENYKLLSAVAIAGSGLKLVSRQERKFTNRFGEIIYEDILHFVPDNNKSLSSEIAREIGRFFLKTQLAKSTSEVRRDMEAAIRGYVFVEPSPIFEYKINIDSKYAYNTP